MQAVFFSCKNSGQKIAGLFNYCIFAALNGSVAQLNRASDYGSEG
jgi:hypothetical protein